MCIDTHQYVISTDWRKSKMSSRDTCNWSRYVLDSSLMFETHLVINSLFIIHNYSCTIRLQSGLGFSKKIIFLIFLFLIKPFPIVVVYLKFLIRISKKIPCLLSKGSTGSEKNIFKAHYSYGPICLVFASILDWCLIQIKRMCIIQS